MVALFDDVVVPEVVAVFDARGVSEVVALFDDVVVPGVVALFDAAVVSVVVPLFMVDRRLRCLQSGWVCFGTCLSVLIATEVVVLFDVAVVSDVIAVFDVGVVSRSATEIDDAVVSVVRGIVDEFVGEAAFGTALIEFLQ